MALQFTQFAYAHHNWQAIYNIDGDKEIEGTIEDLSWRNPHVTLTLVTVDESGAPTSWLIDSNSVASISRMGLSKDMLAPGSQVKVAGYPSRDGSSKLFMLNLLTSDDRELIFRRGIKPRWTTDFVGDASRLVGDVVEPDKTKRPSSIFSVWTTVWGNPDSHNMIPRNSDAFGMTDQALKIARSIDLQNKHPLFECQPKGMPFAMAQPYPIKLIDEGDVIKLHIEEYDAVRTIYLTDLHEDHNIEPSVLGYSTAHWHGDTLFVTTTKIHYDWAMIGPQPLPIPQSPNMHVEESFRLSQDHNRLEYSLHLTDQTMLKEPLHFKKYFQYQPGATLKPYQCN